MSEISFKLVEESIDTPIETFDTLRDCVYYIRMYINNARHYYVHELKDNKVMNFCSAYYLLENYKDLDKVPLSIIDC